MRKAEITFKKRYKLTLGLARFEKEMLGNLAKPMEYAEWRNHAGPIEETQAKELYEQYKGEWED